MVTKEDILKFLKENDLCVLATADKGGKPIAATMAYTADDEMSIYFETSTKTRKYENLIANPSVALVIGVDNDKPSVQIDGKAIVWKGSEATKTWRFILEQHPEWKDYYPDPNEDNTAVYFEVTPKRVCYSDFTEEPPVIEVVKI